MRPGPMSVCIDAVPLLVPSAGVKSYLYHWILSLRNLCGSQLKLFPFLQKFGPLDHEHSVCGRGPTLARLAYLQLLNLRDNAVLDWVGPKVDVFHATKLLYPPKKCRLTATLHDATCWILPEMHTAANVKADKQFAANVLSRAGSLLVRIDPASNKVAVRIRVPDKSYAVAFADGSVW